MTCYLAGMDKIYFFGGKKGSFAFQYINFKDHSTLRITQLWITQRQTFSLEHYDIVSKNI